MSPRATLKLAAGVRRWGTSPAVGFSLGAARHPSAAAVIDVDDPVLPVVSFADLDHRCDAVAISLLDRGMGPGCRIGLMGRNSRGFLEALIAASRAGADVVYINTSSRREAVEELIAAENIKLIIRDREFADLIPNGMPTISIDDKSGIPLLASLPVKRDLPALARQAQHVILTSGTTSGHPRGTGRSAVPLEAAAAVLDAFPVKMRGTHLMAAPMFHSWGWMHHRLATLLDATHVVTRRPDPERILALIDEYQVDTLVTVPVVLRRLVDLPQHIRRRYDMSSLNCVAVSGSTLPGSIATEFMDAFGDVLFNLYGTTEAAFATCATPADLRENPATSGRTLAGVHLEILDRRGRRVPSGTEGRVYVGSRTTFAGYTDGSDRERIRDLVFTGDIGRIDETGLLTIVGRADDVIVTGGENVHPTEVEDVLRRNVDVRDVAVTGAPDPVYGAALVAHVVPMNPKDAHEDILLAWARDRLGPHHRPRRVVFHKELPRTPTGKVLRRVLSGQPATAEEDEFD